MSVGAGVGVSVGVGDAVGAGVGVSVGVGDAVGVGVAPVIVAVPFVCAGETGFRSESMKIKSSGEGCQASVVVAPPVLLTRTIRRL